jgi:hypothetical protein
MTDQKSALHAVSDAQPILERCCQLQPLPPNDRHTLDQSVPVLERLDLVLALQRPSRL